MQRTTWLRRFGCTCKEDRQQVVLLVPQVDCHRLRQHQLEVHLERLVQQNHHHGGGHTAAFLLLPLQPQRKLKQLPRQWRLQLQLAQWWKCRIIRPDQRPKLHQNDRSHWIFGTAVCARRLRTKEKASASTLTVCLGMQSTILFWGGTG